MKKRGSAILIAVFLVAAVGSVAFGIGRMFLAESNLANIYESSTVAYYAAESGIEEGFLRYRYKKNTELPLLTGEYDSSKVSTNNLDSVTQGNDTLTHFYGTVSDNIRYYTLSMNYKVNYYGQDTNVPTNGFNETDLQDQGIVYPKEYRVTKDEAIKIDLSDTATGGKDVDFYTRFTTDDGFTFEKGTDFIEAKLTGETPFGMKELKVALTPATTLPSTLFPAGSYIQLSDPDGDGNYKLTNLVSIIRSTTSLKDVSPIFNSGTTVELYLKPIGCSIRVGLVPGNTPSDKIAGPFSTVKSTGYYGGVTRTLEAKIDRQAGTVYDLFDFVLYKKS